MAGKSVDDTTLWHVIDDGAKVIIGEMSEEDVLNFMIKNNSKKYNKLKAVEELMELALALQQQVLKETRISDKAIIDEIGDVKIRMKILEQLYSEKDIKTRYNYKIKKFAGYIIGDKFGTKYKNI